MTPLALMLPPRPSLLLPLLGLALLGTTGAARALDLDGLVKNSPFGGAPAKAGEEARPGNLEFRGMYVDRGISYFSIYNVSTKQSVWIKQGETADGPVPFVVKAYEPETETIVLDNAGQPARAKLHSANIRTYNAPVAPPVAEAAPAMVNSGVVTVAAGNSGAGFNNGQPLTPEQLQAFREEMRRRFKERNAGGNGNAGGQAGAAETTTNRGFRRDRGGNAGENNAGGRTK